MPKASRVRQSLREADGFQDQDEITLGVLAAIERDSNTSQRMLSSELGVALGLANAYLKRCVRKGWVKIQQVPRRRYAYYLTPQGFSEKARLTGNYLSASFTFFRRAREQMSELMAQCEANGWQRIAFAGTSELAEVGLLCIQDQEIELAGIIDPARAGERYLGVPVVARPSELKDLQAVVVTDLTRPDDVSKDMRAAVGQDRTLVPQLLRSPRHPARKGPDHAEHVAG